MENPEWTEGWQWQVWRHGWDSGKCIPLYLLLWLLLRLSMASLLRRLRRRLTKRCSETSLNSSEGNGNGMSAKSVWLRGHLWVETRNRSYILILIQSRSGFQTDE